MKNPFRSSNVASTQDSPSGLPGRTGSRWPALRGALLGLLLLCTAGFQGFDAWNWRQAAARETEALNQTRRVVENLRRQASTLRDERDMSRDSLERSRAEQEGLSARIRDLEQEHRKASEAQQRLEREMRTALESRDVTISELAGRLTVDILDRVLFASGEAEIKEEGRQILRQVASILDRFPDRQIQVIGHTDNVPIRTPRYPSNWELSAARALAAVRFLSEEAGVQPERLGALAHGEFHPVADNATTEGRAQNRRIAIVVLPEIVTREAAPSPPATAITPPSSPAEAPAPDPELPFLSPSPEP